MVILLSLKKRDGSFTPNTMKKNYYDESVMIDEEREVKQEKVPLNSHDITIERAIKTLCEDELFAVLASQNGVQPVTNLISFATTEDLKHMIFSTPIETRKYGFIKANERVSVLVDNRSDGFKNLNKISAVSATGKARFPSNGESEKWESILIDKHPNLEEFIRSRTTATVVVDISYYTYVRRFQEVIEWMPSQAQ